MSLVPEVLVLSACQIYFNTQGDPRRTDAFSLWLKDIANHKFSLLGQSCVIANLPWFQFSLLSYTVALCLLVSATVSLKSFPDAGFTVDGRKMTRASVRSAVANAFCLHICVIVAVLLSFLFFFLNNFHMGRIGLAAF